MIENSISEEDTEDVPGKKKTLLTYAVTLGNNQGKEIALVGVTLHKKFWGQGFLQGERSLQELEEREGVGCWNLYWGSLGSLVKRIEKENTCGFAYARVHDQKEQQQGPEQCFQCAY